jgi:hypothetical protein
LGSSTERITLYNYQSTLLFIVNYALQRHVSTQPSHHQAILNPYLTLSNPIILPTAYSPALICFGRERGWWITCNYPTDLKERNMEKQKEYNLRYLLAKVRTT